jgi:hypothetical protein
MKECGLDLGYYIGWSWRLMLPALKGGVAGKKNVRFRLIRDQGNFCGF